MVKNSSSKNIPNKALSLSIGTFEDQLIRPFPLSTRINTSGAEKSLATNKSETPKFLRTRGNSSSSQSKFVEKGLASLLLTEKDCNDLHLMRREGKNQFYSQLASFDHSSPVDPKISL